MRLTSISATLWDHRLHVDAQLGDSGLVVIGANESGKSSVLRAVQLALNGPPKGGDASFEVRLGWDKAPDLIRSVAPATKTHTILFDGPKKPREADLAIARDFGDAWVWDPRAFASLSGRARQTSLSSLLDFSWTRDQVTEALASHGLDEPHLWTLVGTHEWQNQANGQRYMDDMIRSLREAWSGATADLKAVKASAKKASERLQSAHRPSGTVASWRAKIAELDDQIGVLRGQLGHIQGASRGRSVVQGRIAEMRGQLEQHRNSSSRVEAAERKATEANAALKSHTDRHRAASARWKQIEERKTATTEQLRAAIARREEMIEQNGIGAAINLLQIRPILEHVAATQADSSLGDRAMELLNTQTFDEDAFERHGVEVSGLRSQLAAIRTTADRAISECSLLDADKAAVAQAATAAKHAVMEARQQHAKSQEAIPEMEKQIAAWMEDLSSYGDDRTPILESQLSSLQEQRAEAVRTADVLNDLVALDEQVQRSAARSAEIIERRDRVRKLGQDVSKVRGNLMAESMRPIEHPASQITQHVLGEGESLSLVCTADEAHIHLGGRSLDTRSESARMVALCALQVAAQAQLKGWRSVLLDGLEAIEANRRTAFVEALGMVEGLDNYIVTCVDDGWRPSSGVQVLHLERPA